MECTKVNCPMQAGTPTDNCGENCPWRTTAKEGDLISRKGYKKVIDEQLRFYDPDLSPWHVKILELQRELLDSMPAVDAVPVIRCRDCKHWCRCDDGISGTCGALGGLWDENEFCSDGERRESE